MQGKIGIDSKGQFVIVLSVKFRPGFPPQDWIFEPSMSNLTTRMRDSDIVFRKIAAQVNARIPRHKESKFRHGQTVTLKFSNNFQGWLWVTAAPVTEVWFWDEEVN